MYVRKFKLKIDVPFLKKGDEFWMHDRDGLVYWIDKGKVCEYPLRNGLAGYLWLLCTEKRYMKFIESEEDNEY